MKAKRSILWVNCAGAAWALGLCLSGQAVFGAPTQWTALHNRGRTAAINVVGEMLVENGKVG